MISIVNILAGLLGSRNGKILGIVAMVGVVMFFIHTIRHKPSREAKLPAVSMLESVQKMQRLDLLQYESNQVLVLGDPSTLQVMLERSIADTVKITKEIASLKLELEKSRVGKESVLQSRSLYQYDLDEHQHIADSVQSAYERMPATFKDFLKATDKQSASQVSARYGTTVANAWSAYHAAVGAEGAGRRKAKREERQKAKEAETALNKAWLDLRKQHLNEVGKTRNTAKEKERDFKHSTHQRTLDRYNHELNSTQQELAKQQQQLPELRAKIGNLKQEMETQQGSGNSFELKRPKMLSVLPTSTNVYLDLKTVSTRIYGDTLVNIEMDSIHYGQVNILIDSSKYYNVSKRSIQLQGEDNGLYFTVFEQLQVGLAVIEERVKQQLESKHFKEQALKRAQTYFEGIYSPLGLKVHFGHLNLPVDTVKVVQAKKETDPIIPELESLEQTVKKVGNSLVSRTRNEAAALGTEARQWGDDLQSDARRIDNDLRSGSKSASAEMQSLWKEIDARVQQAIPKKTTMPLKPVKEKPERVAKNDTLHGIDVSHFNGTIDWIGIAARKESNFTYAKATQGQGFKDPKFDENWTGLAETDIRRGAYHFFVPTDDPKEQAAFFIETVGALKASDLPPMIDIEDTDMGKLTNAEFQANVLVWLKIVEAHYGVKPIVYTYTPYANRYLTHPQFADYKLWVAEYTDAPQPHIPIAWKDKGWYMWQYTSQDEINAISGYVDCDRLIGRD